MNQYYKLQDHIPLGDFVSLIKQLQQDNNHTMIDFLLKYYKVSDTEASSQLMAW